MTRSVAAGEASVRLRSSRKVKHWVSIPIMNIVDEIGRNGADGQRVYQGVGQERSGDSFKLSGAWLFIHR